MQAIASTPFARIASAFWMKPGRCFAEHVGVNAPGSANTTTFFPANRSSVFTGFGPLSCFCISVTDGTLSPTLIVMFSPYVEPAAVVAQRPPCRKGFAILHNSRVTIAHVINTHEQ